MKPFDTHEEFITKCKSVHGDLYDYTNTHYIRSSSPVTIICPIHGEFNQIANSHKLGYGCSKCGNVKVSEIKKESENDFIARVKLVHGDRYDYSITKYIGSKKKIKIICKIHGIFEQTAYDHLVGQNCKLCARRFFGKDEFVKHPDRIGTLYFIKLFNESESFYKVGVTSRELPKRLKEFPYNNTIISEFKDDVISIWELEQSIKMYSTKYRYVPILKFCGYTECFMTDDNTIAKIIKMIK